MRYSLIDAKEDGTVTMPRSGLSFRRWMWTLGSLAALVYVAAFLGA